MCYIAVSSILYIFMGPNLTQSHLSILASSPTNPHSNHSLLYSIPSSRDVRACVPEAREATGRAIGMYAGHVHDRSQQLMRVSLSSDGALVCAGSADGSTCVWDVESYRLVYKLGGHKGSVAAVGIHPTQPVVGTGSVDGTMMICEVARV